MATAIPVAPDALSNDAAATHRRIALQSRADLSYLRATALRAARAKIDLHLPLEAALRDASSGLTEDDLRKTVEQYVAEYVDRVFAGVRSGVEVNGLVYDTTDGKELEDEAEREEQFEAYDTALAERVIGLHARIEQLDTQIAQTRAEAVGAAAATFREGYEELAKEEEAALSDQQQPAWAAEEVTANGDTDLFEPDGLKWKDRQADVKESWTQATARLATFESEVDKTRVKAERAVEVGTFLDGSKSKDA